MAVPSGSSGRVHLEPPQRPPEAISASACTDHPSLLRCREQISPVKNRMLETGASGSVRGGDGNILTYSAPGRLIPMPPQIAVGGLRLSDACLPNTAVEAFQTLAGMVAFVGHKFTGLLGRRSK